VQVRCSASPRSLSSCPTRQLKLNSGPGDSKHTRTNKAATRLAQWAIFSRVSIMLGLGSFVPDALGKASGSSRLPVRPTQDPNSFGPLTMRSDKEAQICTRRQAAVAPGLAFITAGDRPPPSQPQAQEEMVISWNTSWWWCCRSPTTLPWPLEPGPRLPSLLPRAGILLALASSLFASEVRRPLLRFHFRNHSRSTIVARPKHVINHTC
jgi:hypothetical protein